MADEGAMGGDDELDIGEMPLEPEADSLLPGDVKMEIDFIDQDHAFVEDSGISPLFV